MLYATPTKQLARQVLTTARREGVPGALLIGSHKTWDVAEQSAVEGAETIGITTYSAIFNSSPKLPEPRLVILDDAHAGEQFVGEEYGVTTRRHESPEAYEVVLEALSPFCPGCCFSGSEANLTPERTTRSVRCFLLSTRKRSLASTRRWRGFRRRTTSSSR